VARARANSIDFERRTRSGSFSMDTTPPSFGVSHTPHSDALLTHNNESDSNSNRKHRGSYDRVARAPTHHARHNALYVEPTRHYLNPLLNGRSGAREHLERLRASMHRGDADLRRTVRLLRALGELSRRTQPPPTRPLIARARRVVVRCLDRTERVLIVDDARPTQAVALLVGAQLGIRNAEEFSLQYRAHNTPHDAYTWLDPYKSLQEQVPRGPLRLLFKKKFFYTEAVLADDDPVYANLVFCQVSSLRLFYSFVDDEIWMLGARCVGVWRAGLLARTGRATHRHSISNQLW
jgi:hypothetical protein